MPHPIRTIPTQLNADTLLRATSEESSGNVNPQSDSWSEEEKPSLASLDLTRVPEGQKERLRQILERFDNMMDGHLGENNVTFLRIN